MRWAGQQRLAGPSPLYALPLPLQAGRAGRREQESLGIYLGWDGPLDQVRSALRRVPGANAVAARAARAALPLYLHQRLAGALLPAGLQYFLHHPEQLFGRPVERAMVDPRNPSVLGEAALLYSNTSVAGAIFTERCSCACCAGPGVLRTTFCSAFSCGTLLSPLAPPARRGTPGVRRR